MSRGGRRWEEPASSHWEPRHGRSYHDEDSWRHYAPPTEMRSYDYWRDEAVAPTSYSSQRSYRPQSSDGWWHDESHPWQAESSYSRQRRHPEPAYGWDDREQRRDRSSPYRNSPRQPDSSNTPLPSIPQLTLPERCPVESIPSSSKHIQPYGLRKTSPLPSRSSRPPKPSSAYLSLSQEPSEVLQDPRSSRKLLVLDLNGTLLIRSPRSRSSSGPQLRHVQPRPYMQSFRQYLFCAETKTWLDTMVWSSAQPHSVDDMVDKVFGDTKDELKVVWSRKSLGLSEPEYHRKTVTTKDLTRPWALLASAHSANKLEGHSAAVSQPQTIHSAFTTLLLDDSPHKAVLQPYNHVCTPEYNSARRRHDLQTLLATKELKGDKQNKKTKQNQVVTATHSIDEMASGLSDRGALLELAKKEPYDATLLAVIGILDVVKLQSNVAGWIRTGGLWATLERRGEVGALQIKHHSVVKVQDGKTISDTVVPTGNDASSASDPAMTEQTHLQTTTWFDDSLVVSYWVARGRRVLMELGIQVVPGVTG